MYQHTEHVMTEQILVSAIHFNNGTWFLRGLFTPQLYWNLFGNLVIAVLQSGW